VKMIWKERRRPTKAIDRRRLIGGILCGAVAAAAGLALTSAPIEAMSFDARIAGSAGVAGGIDVGASVDGGDASAVSG